MTPDLKAEELKTAEKIAWRIGSKWSAVEIEDLQQHLYLWLIDHFKTVARYREEPKGGGKLYVALKREALKYCTRETAQAVGQPLDRGNFYNTDMLERALPFIFEAWPETQVRQNPHTGQALDRPVEYGNALAIMADISGAFYGLPKDMVEVLEWRFRDGLTLEEIGDLRAMSKIGARDLVARCLKRLADKLSGEPAIV